MIRGDKLAALALIVAIVALWFAWSRGNEFARRRARPGSPFFQDAPSLMTPEEAVWLDAADDLAQQYAEPTFAADGEPHFVADIQPDGTRLFQHDAGW